MIKGYTDTALTAPCCRGGGMFSETKREKLPRRGLSQQQLYLILGRRDGSRGRDRQAGAEAEREEKRRGGSVNTKGGGKNLDTIPS